MRSIFDIRDYEYYEEEYYVPDTDVILIMKNDNGSTLHIERKPPDASLIMYDAIGQDIDNYEDLLNNIRKKFYGQQITAKTMHEIGNEIRDYFNAHLT